MTAETQIIISAKDLASDTFRKVGLASQGLISIFERAQGLVPFAGAGLGVHGLKQFIEHQVEYMDQSGKMAQITGMNTQTFLEFQYAAMLADISTETLSKSVGKLSKNMVAAADGSGDAFDAFNVLGISVKDSAGQLKDADQILEEIAEKFAGFEDGAAKTALAMALFGKGGAEMIPLLNKGAAEMAHLREEAVKMGYAFNDEVARQAEEVNDNFKRLHSRTDALKTLFVSGMLPALVDLSEYFLQTANSSGKLRDNLDIIEGITRGIAYGGVATKNVVDMLGAGMYYTAEAAGWAIQGEMIYAWDALKRLNKSGWEDLNDINRAYEELWLGNKSKAHGAGAEHPRAAKPKAPIIPKGDNGEGASTLKTLREEALKAESALQQTFDTYEELQRTLAGDAFGATLARQQKDFAKEQDEALRELQKIADERSALAAKKKLTPEASGLLDRRRAAVEARLFWLPFIDAEKNALATIQNDLEKMAHRAAHQTTMAELTAMGVWEAKAGAIKAKYEALRRDPKTSARKADWDAEEQAALARNEQERAKARLQSSAALAELTGRTWDHRNAQAELLKIEIALAQTAEERQLKEQQLADVLAQRDGNWVDASRKALRDYEASARDTWSNINRLTANTAQSMEDAMVDSAMGTEDAWTNSLRAIEREIIRVMIRQSAMGQAAGALGGFLNDAVGGLFGGGSWAGSTTQADVSKAYADAGGTSFYRAPYVGEFAEGGPTPQGWTLTGEEGPELRYNPSPGYTFTADQTAAILGGGGPKQVVNNNYYDFRGADTGVETRVRAMLGEMKRQAVAEARAAVAADANRGGRFSKTVGRRQ